MNIDATTEVEVDAAAVAYEAETEIKEMAAEVFEAEIMYWDFSDAFETWLRNNTELVLEIVAQARAKVNDG